MALAAPVEVGTKFAAPALPLLHFSLGPSTMAWLDVYACMVVMVAFLTPIRLPRISVGVVFAFVDKLMVLLAIIPGSVVAGAMVAGLAAQIDAGIAVITRSDKDLTNRDFLVVGIPILFGGVTSIPPDAFFEAFSPMVRALLKNGLVTGVGAVLLLEHVLFRRRGGMSVP